VHCYALQFAGANAVLQAGNVTPFDVQTFRRYFATDGMQFLFGHDAALDSSEVLNQMLFASRGSAPYPLTYALGNVGLDTFTGAAVREPVTGTWLVPGSFGVVAND